MKKILMVFLASVLLGVGAKAQTTVTNNLPCDMEVWQLCLDQNCNIITETLYDVAGNGGSVNIPDCTGGMNTSFFVRYSQAWPCQAVGVQVGDVLGSCGLPTNVPMPIPLPPFSSGCSCTDPAPPNPPTANALYTPGSLTLNPF